MLKYTIVFILLAAGLIQLVNGQNSCPYVSASDGSSYDLSFISNSGSICTGSKFRKKQFSDLIDPISKVHQYQKMNYWQMYYYNISICSPIPEGCAGSCISPNSAAVCQFIKPNDPYAKCFAGYENAIVVGLNNGLGVQITYSGGYECGGCDPEGPVQAIITLLCSNKQQTDPTQITWTSSQFESPMMPPINYFNGTFYCMPAPSAPSSHVSVQYFSTGSDCNKANTYMVMVNRTTNCESGCRKLPNGTSVSTYCDDTVKLPSGTWIEKTTFDNYNCDTPQSAVYTKTGQCSGSFNFSYQTCDANSVYTYSCTSPFCNVCQISDKTPVDTCNSGTMYQCASSN